MFKNLIIKIKKMVLNQKRINKTERSIGKAKIMYFFIAKLKYKQSTFKQLTICLTISTKDVHYLTKSTTQYLKEQNIDLL